MDLWDSGDRVVYTGEVWTERYGQSATVVWCRDGQASIRFDGEDRTTTCMELSLEREHIWKKKFWNEAYERTLD